MVGGKEEGSRDGLVTECELLLPSGMGRVVRSDTIVLSRDTKVYRHSLLKFVYGRQELTFTYLTCGSSSSSEDEGRIVVYKAANTDSNVIYGFGGYISCHSSVSKTFFALKVTSNPDSIRLLTRDLRRNLQVQAADPYPIHLMRAIQNFVDESRGEFCIAITPFPEHGSMRTIMKRMMNHNKSGFSEDLILCALRTVLRGLAPLHDQGIQHTDINAGRLYLGYDDTHGRPVIALAFGAATIDIVDDDDDNNNSRTTTSSFTYLPMASMSHWAAAPEVYHCPTSAAVSAAADVWLVGITALELACGEALFKVANREALEAIIKHIHRTHQLPSPTPCHSSNSSVFPTSSSHTLHDASIDHQTHDKKVNSVVKHFVRALLLSLPRPAAAAAAHSPVPFSKNFTKMVIKCLAWDPKKRPTVAALLSQKFFKTEFPQDDSAYFYDHVKNHLT